MLAVTASGALTLKVWNPDRATMKASRTASASWSAGPFDSFISIVSRGFSESAGDQAGANSRQAIRDPRARPSQAETHRLPALGTRRLAWPCHHGRCVGTGSAGASPVAGAGGQATR